MLRSIFWKEFREQRLVAAFLPTFAVLIIAVTPLVWQGLELRADDITGFNQAVLVMFALGCGLVTGAQHWAAEKEAGTLALLDLQPQWRKSFWWAKTAYALVQWLLQMVVLIMVGVLVSAISTIGQRTTWLPLLFVVCWSFTALCWSQMASARTRTPLAAIGWGLLATLFVPWCAALVMQLFMNPGAISLYYGLPQSVIFRGFLTTATLLILPVLPLVISFRTITLPDRQRLQLVDAENAPVRFAGFRAGWRLAWHDVRGLLWPVGICVVINVLLHGMEPTLLWLALGSLAGVVVGISVTDLEQNQGAFKLWADQRLPLGTLWGAKVLQRFLILFMVTFAAILAKAAAIYFYMDNSVNRAEVNMYTLSAYIGMVNSVFTLVALPPTTGFAIGMLMSLVMSKKIIALFLGGIMALGTMIFWMPMIGSGGLQFVQWAAVPLAFIVSARLLIRPWAAGQLRQRRMLIGLVVPVVFTALYWYGVEQQRIHSVPKAGPLFDVEAYQNETGTTTASKAADRLREISQMVAFNQKSLMWDAHVDRFANQNLDYYKQQMSVKAFTERADQVLKEGWITPAPQFVDLLQKQMSGKWLETLRGLDGVELAALDNHIMMSPDAQEFRSGMQWAVKLLLLDALRLQTTTEANKAEDRFKQALHLSRLVGKHASMYYQITSAEMEAEEMRAIRQWSYGLTRKTDQPALRRMMALLDDHLAKRPTAEEQLKHEYISKLASLENQQEYWRDHVPRSVAAKEISGLIGLSEMAWFKAIGSRYEMKRRRALFDAWMAGIFKASRVDYPTLFKLDIINSIKSTGTNPHLGTRRVQFTNWISPWLENPTSRENLDDWAKVALPMSSDIQLEMIFVLSRRRAEVTGRAALGLLQYGLALRGHRLEHGAYPKTLQELSPAWFAQLPANPFTLRPFRYELIESRAILRADDPFETRPDRGPAGLQCPVTDSDKVLGLVLEPFLVK